LSLLQCQPPSVRGCILGVSGKERRNQGFHISVPPCGAICFLSGKAKPPRYFILKEQDEFMDLSECECESHSPKPLHQIPKCPSLWTAPQPLILFTLTKILENGRGYRLTRRRPFEARRVPRFVSAASRMTYLTFSPLMSGDLLNLVQL